MSSQLSASSFPPPPKGATVANPAISTNLDAAARGAPIPVSVTSLPAHLPAPATSSRSPSAMPPTILPRNVAEAYQQPASPRRMRLFVLLTLGAVCLLFSRAALAPAKVEGLSSSLGLSSSRAADVVAPVGQTHGDQSIAEVPKVVDDPLAVPRETPAPPRVATDDTSAAGPETSSGNVGEAVKQAGDGVVVQEEGGAVHESRRDADEAAGLAAGAGTGTDDELAKDADKESVTLDGSNAIDGTAVKESKVGTAGVDADEQVNVAEKKVDGSAAVVGDGDDVTVKVSERSEDAGAAEAAAGDTESSKLAENAVEGGSALETADKTASSDAAESSTEEKKENTDTTLASEERSSASGASGGDGAGVDAAEKVVSLAEGASNTGEDSGSVSESQVETTADTAPEDKTVENGTGETVEVPTGVKTVEKAAESTGDVTVDVKTSDKTTGETGSISVKVSTTDKGAVDAESDGEGDSAKTVKEGGGDDEQVASSVKKEDATSGGSAVVVGDTP